MLSRKPATDFNPYDRKQSYDISIPCSDPFFCYNSPMAHTIFELGFRNSFGRPQVGINLKDIVSKASSFIPGQAPAAARPLPPPQEKSTSIPPHVIALGGLGILGTIAAIAFGHK
jgi:hypothetical protein